MKRIGQIFFIVVALVFAVYFFSIDYLLKTLIQSEGSKALRAKLDIGAVAFHLLPTSIRLSAVQVTNPRRPLRNIVEFDSLSTPLDLGALNAQNIDLPEVELHGLRFNTERARSGAIAGLTPIVDAGQTAQPDAAQLLAQRRQQLQSDLDKSARDLGATLEKWRQRLQQLPGDSQIADYQQRAQALRSGNKSAELAQLRQQLSGELGDARKLGDDFAVDMQQVRAQIGYAQGVAGGNNSNAMPAAAGNIAGGLLGAEFSSSLQPLLQQLPALIASAANDSTPALLIRKVALDGRIDLGAQPLQFSGSIENLTPQPRLWNVATSFALEGLPTQPSKFTARGSIDLRKTASIDMRFDLREFPLQQLSLSNNPQLGIVVKHAIADIQGLLSSTGNQIDLNLLSRFQQATLEVQAADDPAAQALAAALRDVVDFDLNLQASGDMQKPALKVDSNLNQRLSATLQQLQQARGGDAALQQFAPGAAVIRQLAAQFDELQRQLLAKQSALQSIMDR